MIIRKWILSYQVLNNICDNWRLKVDKYDFEKLFIKENNIDIISELMYKEKLPLILWGAGEVSGAVKEYLEQNNILITAVWLDGRIENNTFGNVPVMSLQKIKEKYSRFNVILGHSNYDLGDEILKKEQQINKVFYFCSILYSQYHNIDYKFIMDHLKEYFLTYEKLQDKQSQRAMIAYLNARMNNNVKYIKECMNGRQQDYFQNDIFQVGDKECYVDVGAYTGDTIDLFLKRCSGKYSQIYAFEPEEKNFRELQLYVENNNIQNISLYNIGTWKEKGTLFFSGREKQKSSIITFESGFKITVDTLDNILYGKSVSFIKINFYNGVLETLMGAKNILWSCKPKLAITVGFDEWALINIPGLIKEIVPEYRLYLRYNRCMPACLVLYAE